MAKILGLDLGTNSIGWAIVDTDNKKVANCGVKIFPNSLNNERSSTRQQRRMDKRFCQRTLTFYSESKLSSRNHSIILTLIFCAGLTVLMTIINFNNWQFWLNLSLTVFVALLTLLYQNKK